MSDYLRVDHNSEAYGDGERYAPPPVLQTPRLLARLLNLDDGERIMVEMRALDPDLQPIAAPARRVIMRRRGEVVEAEAYTEWHFDQPLYIGAVWMDLAGGLG